ncbi:hypothetical protein MSAN_00756500 [Mycena sanguinolenta]|uniref:Uncharacterized protein n=1 Tax=Mycena sanguinolenta TaxID=230812 RepID=A0A8H6Z604_9AGAR|nr:hypothetical protein MSAN_00756500 [Mycena sanguinolenta]
MKFSYTAAIFLALAARTIAHAIPSPALGVRGTPTRADVQRPSTSQPCGSVSIAKSIDNSTAVPVEQDGVTVMLNVTNFNAGADGSRSVSVLVDPTATGNSKNFVKATVTKNGNANPSSDGTDQIKLTLPTGTKCSGGKDGNLCLLSVKTTAGFGACTVVQQLAASTPASASAPATTGTTGATTASKPCSKNRKRRALGTRAPRAMRLQSLHGNPVFAGIAF